MLTKRPGQLSAALKEALGMDDGAPPFGTQWGLWTARKWHMSRLNMSLLERLPSGPGSSTCSVGDLFNASLACIGRPKMEQDPSKFPSVCIHIGVLLS